MRKLSADCAAKMIVFAALKPSYELKINVFATIGLTVVSQDQKCVFCSSIVSNSGENIFDGHSWKCPRCGCYEITGTAESMLAQNKIYPSGAVAGWIRHQNSMGIIHHTCDKQRYGSSVEVPDKAYLP